jgi:hypothetical protein
MQRSSEASERAKKANAYVVPDLLKNPRSQAARLLR